MGSFVHYNCNFSGARFPAPVKIAYGPRGVEPPLVTPVPLYRSAITDDERRKAIEQAFEGISKV
jgi:hypothetical protein